MENFQSIPWKLQAQTFAVGTNFQILLNTLPTKLNNRFCHLLGITFEVTLTAAYTTAPTVIGHNQIVGQMTISDGRALRANLPGGFNDLRMFERLENGGLPYNDAVTNNATTNPVYFARRWNVGPPRMAGSPTDYVLPCAALLNGSVDGSWASAITNISADVTALTASIYPVAHLVLLDDLKVSPFYERKRMAFTNDQLIPGKAAHAFLGLLNSTSYDAFAAGDISDITVLTSNGTPMNALAAEVLGRSYNADFAIGTINGVTGEPRNATYDVNNRIVNLGTPTALAAQALDLQPVIWCPPDCRQTKMVYVTDSNLQVSYSGSGTGTVGLVSRFLEQDSAAVGTIIDEAAKQLKVPIRQEDVKIDTSSGRPYRGYSQRFMPVKAKVPGRV